MERTQSSDMSAWTSDYMPSRRLPARCSCRTAKPPPVQQKHNLYLVLDDWDKGYSIYRVSEDDFVVSDADDHSSSLDEESGHQAESPLVRIKAHHCAWFVAGHETKIFAMNPADSSTGIPVFDTATLSMTVCPDTHTRGDLGERPVYASVGDRFLSFAYPFIDVIGPEPAALSDEWPRTTMEHDLPFRSTSVSGYAVHPDGRTVFMSVLGYHPDVVPTTVYNFTRGRCSTFAFDMERLDWTYIGEWILPFRGQGYYDRELDAWVGICSYEYSQEEGGAGAGRVCCCDVPPDAEPRDTVPTRKLCVDVLFHPDEWHLGTKLVYMGDSKFCLVESRQRPHEEDDDGRYFFDVKMTSFALKYGKVGDLRTTRRRGYASMWYKSHRDTNPANDPLAFWM